MSKLEEFNQSVISLQREVDNLQAIEQAYGMLAKLVTDYEAVISNLSSATENITNARGEIEKQTSSVDEKLIEQQKLLETSTAEQKKEIEAKLKSLQTLVEQKQNELQTLLSENADELSLENKKFYSEFAEMVKTRLDNNKLEIKQLLDQESSGTRQQIVEMKHDYQNRIEQLSKKFFEFSSSVDKQIREQRSLTLVFGIITTVLTLLIVVLMMIK